MINKEYFQVAPGVWGQKIVFVNVYMIADQTDRTKWILVDAAIGGSAMRIKRMADQIFGEGSKPAAIVLTHGHFDHVGALDGLLKIWGDIPIYAHPLEMPYLTGHSSYPPPDPNVGGGLMSLMSFLFPKSPKDLSDRIRPLNSGEEIPAISGWRFIHTPGHAPGHISLYRDSDRTLIAGDAFVTTKQESAFSVITQQKVLTGPPKYFTFDWEAAEDSVKKLAHLQPQIAATGHGMPMMGEELQIKLMHLALNFKKLAVPQFGRYVRQPAITDSEGVAYVPPKQLNPYIQLGFAVAAAGLTYWLTKRKLNKLSGT